MNDNIKLPPHSIPEVLTGARKYAEAYARETVRLNATVPDGYALVPVEPTPDMCKAAVIYANGNAVYKNVAHEALEIEESIYSEVYSAMLSAAPAAPQPARRPLTDDPCPGCQVGTVCRTPKCGRLKLPVDHPLRTGAKND